MDLATIEGRFEMRIHYDNNPKGPTIAVGGEPVDFLDLGQALLKAERIAVIGDNAPSRFYPMILNELIFEPLPESGALLSIAVEGQRLVLSGGAEVAKRLGRSLGNVFGGIASEGQHFHLDYYEDNGYLAP